MGRTKGSGNGSIFKQSTRWRGQLTIDGTRMSVSGKTKKEVVDKLAEIRVKYNSGHYAKRTDITVEDWCMYWLEKYASRTLSYESHYRIAGMFRRYFDSDFKNMKLQELERRHIESLYERRLKDYSYNTIHLFSAEFKRCLEAAVNEGIITHNPHNKVVLPKTNLPKKIFAYTAADQKKILIRCKGSDSIYDKLFLVLIGTGMRFGEATALSWDDIDLDTGMITINKTTVRSIGGTVIKDTTKTSSGMRNIYIGTNVLKILNSMDHSTKLVFPGKQGGCLSHDAAMKHWHKICEELSIPAQGMHALRHTWATRALESGIDIKTISSMLGHKNIITTMNIYQDVLDAQKIKAANTLNALFD